MSIGQAVNQPDWTWTTGGDAPWFGQAAVSRDGSAAQSGAFGASGESWLEAAVEGPGLVVYWGKVSAEAALTVAGTLYSQGAITDAQKDQIITIYRQIEASSKTAAAALQFATTQGQADAITKDVTDLLVQLQKLVVSFQARKTSEAPRPVIWFTPLKEVFA